MHCTPRPKDPPDFPCIHMQHVGYSMSLIQHRTHKLCGLCCGLNEKCPPLFPARELGSQWVVLFCWKKCTTGAGFRVHSLGPLPVFSLCFLYVAEMWLVNVLTANPYSSGLYPSGATNLSCFLSKYFTQVKSWEQQFKEHLHPTSQKQVLPQYFWSSEGAHFPVTTRGSLQVSRLLPSCLV